MGYYHHEYTGIGAVGIRFYRDDSQKSEYNLSKYGEMEKKKLELHPKVGKMRCLL